VTSGSEEAAYSVDKAQNWRMHRYNPANTGVNLAADGPENEVSLSWTYDTGEWTHVPTIVTDTVYVMGSHRVFAVDITDGTERWSVEIGSIGYRSLAVVDDVVYVPTFDGKLLALDTATGDQKWQTQDAGPVSPTVVNGTVYTAEAGSGRVFALAASNGDRRWTTTVGDQTNIESTPAYADGTLFIGTRATDRDKQQGLIRAIDAEAGREQWSFQTGGVSFSAPSIHKETLVVPDKTGMIYALHTDDGTKRWSVETGEAFTCPPTVVEKTVYLGSQEGTLYALNLENGNERWSTEGLGFVNTGATVADQTVYLEAENSLFAFDVDSGEKRWRVQSDMNLMGVVVAGQTIYSGGQKKTQETPSTEYTGQLHAFTA